jgi:hypothetical protein
MTEVLSTAGCYNTYEMEARYANVIITEEV